MRISSRITSDWNRWRGVPWFAVDVLERKRFAHVLQLPDRHAAIHVAPRHGPIQGNIGPYFLERIAKRRRCAWSLRHISRYEFQAFHNRRTSGLTLLQPLGHAPRDERNHRTNCALKGRCRRLKSSGHPRRRKSNHLRSDSTKDFG